MDPRLPFVDIQTGPEQDAGFERRRQSLLIDH
jgi:hypothetical protein